MSNSLNVREKDILLHSLRNYAPELIEQMAFLDQRLFDLETIRRMRQAVGSELADKGFEPNDEPNDYGLELEALIGKIGDLYVWPDMRKRKYPI